MSDLMDFENEPNYEPGYDPSKTEEYEAENERLRELLIKKMEGE